MYAMPQQMMPRQMMPQQMMPQQPKLASSPQQMRPTQMMPQPTQWQPLPQTFAPPGYASAVATLPPAKVRGVSADPVPAPKKFVLPSPEALGVATSVSVPAQPAPAVQVDWNQMHTRMEQIGVSKYEKDFPTPGSVRVTLTLRTSDPSRGVVQGVGPTEAAAVLAALQQVEAWMQKR